jgi:hypothetical protein
LHTGRWDEIKEALWLLLLQKKGLLQRARRHSLCAELLLAGAKHHYQQQGVLSPLVHLPARKNGAKNLLGREEIWSAV